MPLEISALAQSIPAIAAWYADRGLTPRLVIPERLLGMPAGRTAERVELLLVRAATLDYVRVDDGDTDAIARAESSGFRPHHRRSHFVLDTL